MNGYCIIEATDRPPTKLKKMITIRSTTTPTPTSANPFPVSASYALSLKPLSRPLSSNVSHSLSTGQTATEQNLENDFFKSDILILLFLVERIQAVTELEVD